MYQDQDGSWITLEEADAEKTLQMVTPNISCIKVVPDMEMWEMWGLGNQEQGKGKYQKLIKIPKLRLVSHLDGGW